MSPPSERRLQIEHVDQVDSTNSELLRRDPLVRADCAAVWLVARRQTAGRGRRQRTWSSAPDTSLTASLGCEVLSARNVGLLPLVAGVAIADALGASGVEVGLKWPNDIYRGTAKAGGILCEVRARGPAIRMVIGCGLNLVDPPASSVPGREVAGLFGPDTVPDRDRLAILIGETLFAALLRFQEEGFEPFRLRWHARDLLRSRPIVIHDYHGERSAIAHGIDQDGALLVELTDRPGELKRLVAEEVSVRPRASLVC